MNKMKEIIKRLPKFLRYILVAGFFYGAESLHAHILLEEVSPFPWLDYWELLINGILRDIFIAFVIYWLYLKRSRIPDRLKRYFPVVVVGTTYLGFALYMCIKLRLDPYFLTATAFPAGLMNNIVLLLAVALFYNMKPNRFRKTVYFVVYMLSILLMIVDVVYFWQTSMHVQSVFFRNLNIYAVEGVMSSFSLWHIALFIFIVVVAAFLFRLPPPKEEKPEAAWAILAVCGITLLANLFYFSMSQLGIASLHASGLWSEEQIEKSRQEYRDILVTPITANIAGKAVFKKEKVIREVQLKKRVLTAEDKKIMYQLGVMHKEAAVPLKEAAYDRIVFLILESVHRDFIHSYNSNIPAEATPFLDKLLVTCPHINNFYSSGLPTTEGLNAIFRSQLFFDNDIKGSDKPSLFRLMQKNGYDGYFQSASSRYYNSEFKEYREQFGMENYEAREDMDALGYTGASGWGYHNDEMYRRTLEQLKNLRGEKYIYVTKTLDMHQPYPYYATKWEDTPESFRNESLVTIHGMYWVDTTLKKFFEEAKAEGLMDDRTLYIITSDHNPHSGGEYEKIVSNPEDRKSIAPIPLIFVSSNSEPLKNIKPSTYASQIDIAPTILCLSGIQPPVRFIGRNLLQRYKEPAAALGLFGDKAYYYSSRMSFVDKIDAPYPANRYEDSLADFCMYNYYINSLPWNPKE